MKPKVFLTRRLPPEPMKRLAEETDLTFDEEDRILTKAQVIEGVKASDALVCLLSDAIDEEVLSANPDLKIVANYAVGYNNIDLDAAKRHDVIVTNTPGVLTDATADMTFALLMAAGRRVVEGDGVVRTGKWEGWAPLQLLGQDITGATLGLIGLGRIGKAVVKRATGFSMDVIYWNRTRLTPDEEKELGVRYAPMDEVLTSSDFVSLHVALTDDTKHLIGKRELALMKPTATIINTARGPVIDESALVEALSTGTIGSAALDVYEYEPELSAGLSILTNVVTAPHLGSATVATRTKMGNMVVDNCLAACRGEEPPNQVV